MARKVKGLSLAEILVAMALLSVALLTMIAIFTKNLSLADKTEEMTVATELGKSQLQHIRVMDSELVPVSASFLGAPANSDGFPPSPYPQQTMEGRIYHLQVRTFDQDPFVRVEVTVVWDRGRSSLTSLLRR